MLFFLLLISFLSTENAVFETDSLHRELPILSRDSDNRRPKRMGDFALWKYSINPPQIIIDGPSLRNSKTTLFYPSVNLRKLENWEKYVWLELSFIADSTVANQSFKMKYFDHGGAKFWLNGRFIGQSGNPSVDGKDEILGSFINPDFFGITLREGVNHLLVEYSEHTLPLIFERSNYRNIGIEFFATDFWINLRRERAFLFGGALTLLLLLILLNSFLWRQIGNEFHGFVVATTFFLGLHAAVQLSDTIFDLTHAYIYVFEPVNAVVFLFALYFYLLAIRSYYGLTLRRGIFTIITFVFVTIFLVLMFVGRSYLEITQSVYFVAIVIWGSNILWNARNNMENKQILPIAFGLIGTLLGAALYLIVYTIFEYRETWVLQLVIFLAYTSIPISLTFTNIIDYTSLFRELEKKVEERTAELEQAISYKTRFFENISHEYRTPLTIAQGLLSRIIKTTKHDEILIQKLIPVQRNMDRLSNMVEQVLALSSIDNEALELEEELLFADEVVTICTESFRSLAEIKSQDIIFLPNAPDVQVLVDRNKMESIVNNLLSNAIKYNSINGAVIVRSEVEDDTYTIIVEDNGRGIDPSNAERIFERFHRIKQNENEYVEGVGIGLELSRSFARAMNGDIVVDTTYQNGARFKVSLPVQLRSSEEFSATNLPELNSIGTISPSNIGEQASNAKVLIVEDNDDMGFYLTEILSEMGTVARVSNGVEAIEWLQTSSCELIITDLMMPKMTGEQLVLNLSMHPSWSRIPIVVLSAKALELDRMKLLRYGVVDFISKPFHSEELYLRINNLLDFARNRKRINEREPEFTETTSNRISENIATFVIANVENNNLSIESIAQEFDLSRRTLYRQVEAETGMSLAAFIKEIRLQHARNLVAKTSEITIKDLASKVGYKDATSFRKLYVERFGIHPLDDLSK